MKNILIAALAAASLSAVSHAQTFGAYGFDTAGMDTAIRPADNFYGYANGAWAKTTPIPADKSNYGMFTALDDLSKKRTKEILDQALADPNSRMGNAYASYLDLQTVEKLGMKPIAPWLDTIRKTGKGGYAKTVAEAMRARIDTPFAFYVGQDDKAPEHYILNLSQSGLGMPDRDYYLKDDAAMQKTRAAYVAHLARVLTSAGEKDAEKRAAALMAFETEIAKVHWTKVDSRDSEKTYNKMTLADLRRLAPGFDFDAMLKAAGYAQGDLIVAQPTAIAGIAKLVAATPQQVLNDALIIRSIDNYAEFLPEAVAKEEFSFYGTELSGTPEREERWKRAVTFLKENLGDDVGKIYVERYFPPETKAAADQLVKNVLAAMGRRIDALSWMTPETKTKARAKLASFTTKIGYPDQWRDYSAMTIARNDLFGNALRARQFDFDYNKGKLGQPIRRWEWFMTPMEINAYANFPMNEIVFPAAILQPPFFDPKADPAVNYGGIGAVIGHEISHHFDDQGSKYDPTGRLNTWWNDTDRKNFEALTDRLVKQYDAYQPLPGMHVQGKLTLGENIGDLAGVAIALDAYHASLDGRKPPVIAGVGGDQRFFLGWAQVWRRNYREANLRQRLLTDPHAPSEQRANIVRNFDSWYTAFKPDADGKIVLKPEDRVHIW